MKATKLFRANWAFIFCSVLISFLSNNSAFAIWTSHNQLSFRCPIESKEVIVSEQDRVAIRKTIAGQLQAFRSGDKEIAFSYASPGIKQQFETAAEFFASVKSAYDIVLVPRSVVFEDVKEVMGVITQPVLFLASDGDAIIGSYIMEKQDNGDWKISGCYLAPIK